MSQQALGKGIIKKMTPATYLLITIGFNLFYLPFFFVNFDFLPIFSQPSEKERVANYLSAGPFLMTLQGVYMMKKVNPPRQLIKIGLLINVLVILSVLLFELSTFLNG